VIVVVVVGAVYPPPVPVVVDPVQVVMVCDVDDVEEVVVGGRVVGVNVCCVFPSLPQAHANPAVTTTSTTTSARTVGTFAERATRSPIHIATSALTPTLILAPATREFISIALLESLGPPLPDQ
jgi:hypothetical protein